MRLADINAALRDGMISREEARELMERYYSHPNPASQPLGPNCTYCRKPGEVTLVYGCPELHVTTLRTCLSCAHAICPGLITMTCWRGDVSGYCSEKIMDWVSETDDGQKNGSWSQASLAPGEYVLSSSVLQSSFSRDWTWDCDWDWKSHSVTITRGRPYDLPAA